MAGTRRCQHRRQRQKAARIQRRQLRKDLEAQQWAAAQAQIHRLPPDVLAEIHRRLDFVGRLAFASGCGASAQNLLRETPWLLLPGPQDYDAKATVLSVADAGKSASVRTSDVALRGHVAIGSSGGWLVTADDRAALRMANPVTGAHADLPAISTVPFIVPIFGGGWFRIDFDSFRQIRSGGPPPPEHQISLRTCTLMADQMREVFYRKVVLSESPSPGSYAAMLITDKFIGAPAFTTAEDPVWRMAAPSRDGVEDAIHHNGRFLSITYAGHVDAWRRDVGTGEFTCLRKRDDDGSYSYGTDLVDELRDVGVYSLKTGRTQKIDAVGKNQLWPPPAWFTPSFL